MFDLGLLAALPANIDQIRDERPIEALGLYQRETDFWSMFWSAMLTKWNVSNVESLIEFESAIAQYPDSELLRLEYARNLAELLRYREASAILDSLIGGEYDTQARSVMNAYSAVSVSGQAFRPDDKNRFGVDVYARMPSLVIDGDISASVSYQRIDNPSTDLVTAIAEIHPDPYNSIRIGASVLPSQTVLSAGYTYSNDGWRISYDYRANLDDPVAIQSAITQHVVELGYQSIGGKVSLNSDGIEVYEAWGSVPITQWASVEGYGRAASADSPNYWAPSSFGTLGLRMGVDVGGGCLLGVQPSIVSDEGIIKAGVPLGAQCDFGDGSVSASLGYGLSLNAQYRF